MPKSLLLGVAQDAGLPQMGCSCTNCTSVKEGTLSQEYAVSLALLDDNSSNCWLIDASPDIKRQYDLLMDAKPGATLAGLLLTHLHMGHYTGLLQLGKEAMNVKGLPVYGTASVCRFLESNQPWKQMVTEGNIVLRPTTPGTPIQLAPGLEAKPVLVPHRAEFSDTVAYYVQGPSKTLFYVPDIDSWDLWETDVREVVEGIHLAFLDACFYSGDELPGRDMSKIPHPLVTDTLKRLKGLEERYMLIHMNHTNPLHRKDSPQRRECELLGVQVGHQGLVVDI